LNKSSNLRASFAAVHESGNGHYPEVVDTTRLRRLSENKLDLRREGPESTLLTHQRHWLALRQVLMPVQPLSKYWFEPIQCCVC
jgi:hypothetical protein